MVFKTEFYELFLCNNNLFNNSVDPRLIWVSHPSIFVYIASGYYCRRRYFVFPLGQIRLWRVYDRLNGSFVHLFVRSDRAES